MSEERTFVFTNPKKGNVIRMIDKFDYAEPSCPLCEGKDFYYPKVDAPLGRIPVGRVIDKVDSLFGRNDCREAGRLLVYWRDEAIALRDKSGELAMESELVGYYRKQGDRGNALASVNRALVLTDELSQGDMVSGATVLINCATAYKAFGMPEESLPLYIRAEEVYKKVLSPSDPRFGGLYNNMALALADLGRYGEAERAYFSALEVMDSAGGDAECAITYINLAHMYDACGDGEKPLELMARALEKLESDSLAHDGYYAFVLEKCAPSFEYFGQTEISDRLKREAERIYEGT